MTTVDCGDVETIELSCEGIVCRGHVIRNRGFQLVQKNRHGKNHSSENLRMHKNNNLAEIKFSIKMSLVYFHHIFILRD